MTFARGFVLDVGEMTATTATADFDGDRRDDIAVANGHRVTVLLNREGILNPARADYPVGLNPQHLVSGDFNGDGKPDMATGNEGRGYDSLDEKTVSVLLNQGEGAFSPAVETSLGVGTAYIRAADLNGDGKTDLVTTNSTFSFVNSVGVLLGKGDGTFETKVSYKIATGKMKPTSLTIQDFNRDGWPDIAVVSNDTTVVEEKASGILTLLINREGGRMELRSEYPAGKTPLFVTAADLNGDTMPDLVVADTFGKQILQFMGKGDGTLSEPASLTLPGPPPSTSHPASVLAGEFTGDGKTDLIGTTLFEAGLYLMIGRGDGTFSPPIPFTLGIVPRELTSGDYNTDGRTDLVIPLKNKISLIYNVSAEETVDTPRFATGVHYSLENSVVTMAAGDINGDGKIDLLTLNGSIFATALFGKGDGTFPTSKTVFLNEAPTSVITADLNMDEKTDLITFGEWLGGVRVHLGNGDGTFKPRQIYAVEENVQAASVGDINADGHPDLVILNREKGTFSILNGVGDGSFLPAIPYSAEANPWSVAVGDLNGDGLSDLAVLNRGSTVTNVQGSVSVRLNAGEGRFGEKIDYAGGYQPHMLGFTDFNRDGKTDLFTMNSETHSEDGTVSLLAGKGDGTFDRQRDVTYRSPHSSRYLPTDFNEDGLADPPGPFLILGYGHGIFIGDLTRGSYNESYLTVADFNGDGAPDLAAPRAYDRKGVSVYMNTTGCRGYIRGDVSGDRQVNVQDAVFALQISVGLRELNEECALHVADLNCNRVIGVEDAVLILKHTILGEPISICSVTEDDTGSQ